MRHGKKINHLSRTASHRGAMLSNMASSLIKNKRIETTVAKAKALRKYVEPLITKAKSDTTHSRRVVFSYLQDKDSVQVLFNEVADRVANRPGGYTRIIKTGNRLGDAAEMCFIELVDYNELMLKEEKPAKSKTRRSRRGGAKKTTEAAEAKVETKKAEKEEVVETQESTAEATETENAEATESPEVEAKAAVEEAVVEEATEEAPKQEEPKAEVEAKAEADAKDAKEEKKEEDKKEEENTDEEDAEKK